MVDSTTGRCEAASVPQSPACRRDRRGRVHECSSCGLGELYDLKNGERVNRINDPAAAARVAALKQELNRLMMAAGLTPQADQMPIDQGIKKELPGQKIR